MGVWATSQQVGAVFSTALAACLLGVAGWRFAVYAPALFVVISAALLQFAPLEPPWQKKAKEGGGDDAAAGPYCDTCIFIYLLRSSSQEASTW